MSIADTMSAAALNAYAFKAVLDRIKDNGQVDKHKTDNEGEYKQPSGTRFASVKRRYATAFLFGLSAFGAHGVFKLNVVSHLKHLSFIC